MDLSPETVEAKKRDLAEALAKRDNSARAVESLKEDLKTERGYLASLDSLIRSLSLEVATGKGLGDQLPLPGTASPPKASAAERTISLPLESNATPPPEAPASEESKADLATRNQIRSFVTSFDGQKVTFAQIVDAFPGHAADVLRAQLALLVEREEVFALLDGWRGRLGEAPSAVEESAPSPEPSKDKAQPKKAAKGEKKAPRSRSKNGR